MVTFSYVNSLDYGFLSVTKSGFVSFREVRDLDSVSRRIINKGEKNLKKMGVAIFRAL